MRYLVTKEIKSETQVVWKLYFRDFIFLVIWVVGNLYIQNMVHTYLRIPFGIFAILIGIILILPSNLNPKRRQYQSIALYLIRKTGTLYYLPKERKKHEQEDRNKKYKRNSSGIKVR